MRSLLILRLVLIVAILIPAAAISVSADDWNGQPDNMWDGNQDNTDGKIYKTKKGWVACKYVSAYDEINKAIQEDNNDLIRILLNRRPRRCFVVKRGVKFVSMGEARFSRWTQTAEGYLVIKRRGREKSMKVYMSFHGLKKIR